MDSRRDEPRDVRDVGHEHRTDLVRDLAERAEVDDARVRGGARHDELRLRLLRLVAHLVHVDAAVGTDVVVHGVVELAGAVDRRAVREMPAVREVEAEERVSRLDRREVDRLVRLRARVRLHVRADLAALDHEERLRAVAREVLDLVDELAAAVVPLAR
jgi:hypothetical protein